MLGIQFTYKVNFYCISIKKILLRLFFQPLLFRAYAP